VTTAALIVAAGRGSRAATNGAPPKQYALLAGRPVLEHSLRAFAAHPGIDAITVVIHPDDGPLYERAAEAFAARLARPVHGGRTRQESVRLGLEALARQAPDQVLIHDAARPLVEADVIARVCDALTKHAGAITAEPVADTLKRASAEGTIAATLDRTGLWRAQTPQGFHFSAILAAHRRAAAEGREDFTDDAALAEWAGLDVALVAGSSRNVKLTSAGDLAMAARLLSPAPTTHEPRTGTGFDVHRFGPGDHVWLAGVRIAHTAGLEGHSDADAALHALTDAILGALGDGDIGEHFPPSDPTWRGAPSRLFVADAAARVAARGGRISNVDVTIVAQSPRIAPHRDAMREAIAGMLGIEASRVGVKATTTEELGFTGRREGLAALASATILLPV
jgi:2-C-methyl-D-erythritol 4-phosphate cytidylyltransferase/2-C-methyl-D-erythritol 2,4-cyclodiphosphate synthase